MRQVQRHLACIIRTPPTLVTAFNMLIIMIPLYYWSDSPLRRFLDLRKCLDGEVLSGPHPRVVSKNCQNGEAPGGRLLDPIPGRFLCTGGSILSVHFIPYLVQAGALKLMTGVYETRLKKPSCCKEEEKLRKRPYK